jgi:predicted exporter
MFRTSYRTHLDLSSLADNKANIMISINGIIISILLATVYPSIIQLRALFLPSSLLLLTCLASLVLAVLVVAAIQVLAGERLTLLHLVGMLLTVAVGSNYGLFLEHQAAGGPVEPRTLASLLVANLTTVIGFGVLATSELPVLRAMGTTVTPGVVLALVFSAILARGATREPRAAARSRARTEP